MDGNKHYIRVDNGTVVYGFSDAFETSLETDICINENGGRHFELFGVINPPLYNFEFPIYKYENGKIIKTQ